MATNLADLIAESAARRPAKVAIVDGDRRVTYAGLDDRVSATAAGLLSKGIKHGDRVALLLENGTDFVIALFAVLRAGAVAVPLNTGSTANEIQHAVSTVGARLLVCDSTTNGSVAGADLGGCVRVLADASQWEALQQNTDRSLIPIGIDPESIAVLLFTAGSTGSPKAAMLPHRALMANVEALLALDEPPAARDDDIVLAILPLFHVYSLNAVLSLTLAAGATVVLSKRFSARNALNLIEKHKVTVVAGAPPMYVAWSAETGLRTALARVRLLTSGAAPLPPALFDQFQTLTGKPIWEGYGLTECSPVVSTALVNGRPKAGSVGVPLPNLEVRVVPGAHPPMNTEPDEEAEDETGEIWVRGPSVFAGYWPDGSDGPNEDGWFGTGDMGYFDDERNLHLVDRRSDLILVSGFNVYPREVEHAIEAMPGVLECAVIGVAHPYSGEAVKAFVAVESPGSLEPADIVEWCETRLAKFKCPTIVDIVDRLPHAATGKIAKRELREL